MARDQFELVSVGLYDDTFECIDCGFRCCISADASQEENDDRMKHECNAEQKPGSGERRFAINELELLRRVAELAEFTVIESRREFDYGELPDIDKLEEALKAWRTAQQKPDPVSGDPHG